MTLTDCQLLSIVAQLGTFAAAAERLHITPSAVSHAVSGVEAECGFPLFTRTKSGVTLTAAAEKLMPAIQQMLASSESLDQSIAQINGMHKGALRLGVFNSACVTWLPKIVPGFRAAFPGIDVQIYHRSSTSRGRSRCTGNCLSARRRLKTFFTTTPPSCLAFDGGQRAGSLVS